MATKATPRLAERRIIAITCLLIISSSTLSQVYPSPQTEWLSNKYFALGVEATDWVKSFQVTPLSSDWGIPYPDSRVWGLDPYYYSNGTVTSDTGGIKGGEQQRSAYLIGGHDAGLGASAALAAFLSGNEEKYSRIFNVYYGYFERSQLPTNASQTQARTTYNINGRNETLDESGYWAEQASVVAGQGGLIGSATDNVQLVAAYPAAEHGNPIAAALIAHYRLTHNQSSLNMLNKYGNWLLRVQIKNGQYSGAFPVTQYYWLMGWKPRMYETTESAWILSELYRITGNRTYLQGAIKAGDYMLSRQLVDSDDSFVQGALPYEWNRTQYSQIASTNHAGFTILAWVDLYRLTSNPAYLTAAQRYANWLLNMQVTTPDYQWGDHRFANDSMTVGGYYYGYDTGKHSFGWRSALSLWSAAYAIPGLLALWQAINDTRYFQSARLAIDWLAKMQFTDQTLTPLQALATIKYVASSYWGKYPQFYQPDWSQVESAGIPKFVNSILSNPSALHSPHPTWFENTFGLDFNTVDYQMASRGPQYMKMIWSWWPNAGFEPRYGDDIAFGAFAIASFLAYTENISAARSKLSLVQDAVQVMGADAPSSFILQYNRAKELLENCTTDFEDGWYSIATAKLRNVERITNSLLTETKSLGTIADLKRTNQIATITILSLLIALTGLIVYFSRKHSLTRR